LAQGLLSGKYNQYSNFDQSDRRFRLPHFQNGNWENNRSILDLLQILSKKYNKSISQLAIRWAFDGYKVVDCVIAGAKTPDQVEKNYGSLGFELSINDIQMINMLLN
jgi:aryl-alcohol dehydrogenase-like predicted oxidoreductase